MARGVCACMTRRPAKEQPAALHACRSPFAVCTPCLYPAALATSAALHGVYDDPVAQLRRGAGGGAERRRRRHRRRHRRTRRRLRGAAPLGFGLGARGGLLQRLRRAGVRAVPRQRRGAGPQMRPRCHKRICGAALIRAGGTAGWREGRALAERSASSAAASAPAGAPAPSCAAPLVVDAAPPATPLPAPASAAAARPLLRGARAWPARVSVGASRAKEAALCGQKARSFRQRSNCRARNLWARRSRCCHAPRVVFQARHDGLEHALHLRLRRRGRGAAREAA